jgi:hypothetical protein
MIERNKFQVATDNTKVQDFRKRLAAVAEAATNEGLSAITIADELLTVAAKSQSFKITDGGHWLDCAAKRIAEWKDVQVKFAQGVRTTITRHES